MNVRTLTSPMRGQHGVVLLEVLVSIIILAIGLLGLAKLQASTRQLEMESYQRAQAMILLQDMVNRLSANNKAAQCYAFTDAGSGAPWVGTGGSAPTDCAVGTANQQAAAINDLAEWNALLSGAAETDNGENVGAMIGARGCVSFDFAANAYLVTVTWQGLVNTGEPSAGLTCATGEYDSEDLRRAVSAWVYPPTLDVTS